MKRLLFTLGLFLALIIPQTSWAKITSPYPDPNRQTMWNNLTDGIHTLGQNPQQTRMTLRKLHNKRTNARLNSISQAEGAKRKARRQAWLNSHKNPQ